ncbi:MmcQ/YjbR family DNA-binding protein [Elizabethkingia sp. JS20170427COW]|uniref:MmcQ/YjbR family DNA-binding protein n=1 Tax=Elizabethkingia sp. JS20170427COW TaxID=2583851 RepID=UPI001110F6BD|nr:MmcQ/YjbR family DNA-binding protein [Elizabethkingia sp. JS20170427COW]QCX54195.1 MmcQ/YjbR family DNA-binding protein [Elizabethkingia sp. JS20170427COW]
MNIEEFRTYCLSLPAVTEELPFGPDYLVFKVGGKIFALCSLNSTFFKVNLKHDVEKNTDLREEYEEVEPGYHMNKKHWNTVNFEGKLSDNFLKDLIKHSYEKVIQGLSKKKKQELLL